MSQAAGGHQPGPRQVRSGLAGEAGALAWWLVFLGQLPWLCSSVLLLDAGWRPGVPRGWACTRLPALPPPPALTPAPRSSYPPKRPTPPGAEPPLWLQVCFPPPPSCALRTRPAARRAGLASLAGGLGASPWPFLHLLPRRAEVALTPEEPQSSGRPQSRPRQRV